MMKIHIQQYLVDSVRFLIGALLVTACSATSDRREGDLTFGELGGSGVESDISGPSSFFVTDDGDVIILDRINSRFVVETANGHRSAIAISELLPSPTPDVLDFRIIGDQLYLLSEGEVRTLASPFAELQARPAREASKPRLDPLAIFRSTGVILDEPGALAREGSSLGLCDGAPWSEAAASSWSDQQTAWIQEYTLTAIFEREAPYELAVRFERTGAGAPIKAQPIVTDAPIGSAFLVGVDRYDNAYVLIETIEQASGRLRISASVFRYALQEATVPYYRLDAKYSAPIWKYRSLPLRYVNVNSRGQVWLMKGASDNPAWVTQLTPAPIDIPFAPEPDEEEELALANAELEAQGRELLGGRFAQFVRKRFGLRRESSGAQSTTRTEIMARADQHRSLKWTLSSDTYGPPPSSADACERAVGRVWRRPTRLNGALNEPILSMPYKWGGWDSVSEFLGRDEAIAGDVCTCRTDELEHCVLADTRGVDCSGFVTLAWRIPTTAKYGTSTLQDVSDPIRWEDLKCGDVLNRPGRHVRLFSAFRPEFGGLIEYYESSLECGGVCKRFAPFAKFQDYQPRRYQHVAD